MNQYSQLLEHLSRLGMGTQERVRAHALLMSIENVARKDEYNGLDPFRHFIERTAQSALTLHGSNDRYRLSGTYPKSHPHPTALLPIRYDYDLMAFSIPDKFMVQSEARISLDSGIQLIIQVQSLGQSDSFQELDLHDFEMR